jgi:iron-sulfur cluster assembly protein
MSVSIHKASLDAPNIQFTTAAKQHVLNYLHQHPEQKGIRLSVKKTGCSGLSYVVDYVQLPTAGDLTVALGEEYILCIDKSSYPYLKDMQVDYVKQGLQAKLVFNNPNQTGLCGCGESFTVE